MCAGAHHSGGWRHPAPSGRGFLDFGQEVLVIPVAAAPPQQGPDVAVDRLDLPERDLLVAVGEDTVAMPQQELGDPAERWQPLPPERAEPRGEEAAGGPPPGVVPERKRR